MISLNIKKNVKYSICSCGLSKKMPYCDNEHRKFNQVNNTNYKSIKIIPSESICVKLDCNTWKKDKNE